MTLLYVPIRKFLEISEYLAWQEGLIKNGLVGNSRLTKGNESVDVTSEENLMLKVDDRGRIRLPQEIRDQLRIGANDEVPAALVGSVLKINPNPISKLEMATTGRETWENTTPADAGEVLFGPADE